MNAAEVRRVLNAQTGPETARRIGDAFDELERDRAGLDRELGTLRQVIAALAAPRVVVPALERDAIGLMGACLTLRRVAALVEHALTTGRAPPPVFRRVWDLSIGGAGLAQMLRPGPHSGDLRTLLELAIALHDAARAGAELAPL